MSFAAERTRAFVQCVSLLSIGCETTSHVGAAFRCGEEGVTCDLDGGLSDEAFPIGEPEYTDFNQAGFDRLAQELAGEWRGVVAANEEISDAFQMRFVPSAVGDGRGAFHLECPRSCLPLQLGRATVENPRTAEGTYNLIYVDGEPVGEGEFAWTQPLLSINRSNKFRGLRIQSSDDGERILSFVIDRLPDTWQFVLVRGSAQDAETAEGAPP